MMLPDVRDQLLVLCYGRPLDEGARVSDMCKGTFLGLTDIPLNVGRGLV